MDRANDTNAPDLVVVTLTERERRVIYRALTMSSAMLDALGDYLAAATAVELACRINPEGNDG